MCEKTIDNLIKCTLDCVYDNDQYLIERDVHEVTIVFRFAHYLAYKLLKYYPDYRVDIEYNRDEDHVKKIDNKLVRIDLVVHKRGIKDNLVAIEFKKKINSSADKKKLENLFKEYHYKNVYFIILKKR